MKLYIFQGLASEKVPDDVTHVTVDESVTIIKTRAFQGCKYLVSVIMSNNVKRIEQSAFVDCIALQFVQLSKTLEFIGNNAFRNCKSLGALFLPSLLKSIGKYAFHSCRTLRLLILPHGIDLTDVDMCIITDTAIEKIACSDITERTSWRVERSDFIENLYNNRSEMHQAKANIEVHHWLIYHMGEAPLHELCYNSSVTTNQINHYLNVHGNYDSSIEVDMYHDMTPLHILAMNPHAPADAIASLLDYNMDAVFCLDNNRKTPLEYAREYNVGGMVAIITSLCNHRNSLLCVE